MLVPLPTPGAPHSLVQPSWPSYPTTYSNPPNLGPIYNPAPPPSTYMAFAGPNINTNQSFGLSNASVKSDCHTSCMTMIVQNIDLVLNTFVSYP